MMFNDILVDGHLRLPASQGLPMSRLWCQGLPMSRLWCQGLPMSRLWCQGLPMSRLWCQDQPMSRPRSMSADGRPREITDGPSAAARHGQ